MNIGNCTIINVDDVVCVDQRGVRVGAPNVIVICGDFAFLVEEAKVADIGEVRQLINAMEALKSGQCDELEPLVRDKNILAGIVHGETVKWSARCIRSFRNKYKILVAGCRDDFSIKLRQILSMVSRSSP